ncbi:MAG TPA: VacJ family lipoprotein [Dissulfurispiraceae bacterium]|nr:VacJ family lipoprotein [Dissulfurispiraceae bacterium]
MKLSPVAIFILPVMLCLAIPAAHAFDAASALQTAERLQGPDAAEFSEAQARLEEVMIALADKDSAEEQAPETAQAEDERDAEEGRAGHIADPLAPLNKVVFQFNDKLYFWGIKPVTQAYSHVVPEEFRFAFANVYDNLWSPARIVNNLLQLRLKAAGNEFVRFAFNSFAGIGGMGDMADKALGIKKQDADFGQTLGHYGIGHGIYLVLPVFGPSSIRDGIGLVGDRLMHPLTYVKSSNLTFGQKLGIIAHERVNSTSFRIGDYESFKEAAIDPYVSMRDAFVQSRQKAVEESNR